jgi:flagellar biogenesis protein FliO
MEIAQTNLPGALARMFTIAADRCRALWRSRSRPKALSVCETAALGERRFVAVVQFERLRFLVGASPASVTLLAQLPDAPPRGNTQ